MVEFQRTRERVPLRNVEFVMKLGVMKQTDPGATKSISVNFSALFTSHVSNVNNICPKF